jgi:uncharacterized protein YqgC (DUF456 family)
MHLSTIEIAWALLAVAQLAGVALVPVGLPGTWLQVVALGVHAWLVPGVVGVWPVVAALVLALVGEVIETLVGAKLARRHGGSTRAAWGAILGGMVGAIVGVPLPIVGSVVGALVGSFLGAALLELTARQDLRAAAKVGYGALLGRLVAVTAKSFVAIAIAVVALWAAAG